MLPIAIPLGLLAGVATVVGGFLLLIAWILGGLLSLFHPWLAYLPYAIATVILIGAAWEALGEAF